MLLCFLNDSLASNIAVLPESLHELEILLNLPILDMMHSDPANRTCFFVRLSSLNFITFSCQ